MHWDDNEESWVDDDKYINVLCLKMLKKCGQLTQTNLAKLSNNTKAKQTLYTSNDERKGGKE